VGFEHDVLVVAVRALEGPERLVEQLVTAAQLIREGDAAFGPCWSILVSTTQSDAT